MFPARFGKLLGARALIFRFVCPIVLVALFDTAMPAQVPESAAPVGWADDGSVRLPVNQTITPAGRQVELTELRPQVLRLSPDGQLLATSGKTPELVLVDPASGTVRQRVPLPSDAATNAPGAVSTHILAPDKDGQVSYTGLIFSRDGTRIFLSNVNGSVKVFAVGPDHQVSGWRAFSLPPTGNAERTNEIPAGLALSVDGQRLYVAGNLSNQLLELDATSGQVLRTFAVGFAPYDVVVAGRKAYVSNWGGRRPDARSLTGPAGKGTLVRVDPVRHIASEGSVSVLDLESGRITTELLVGRHASALALTPDGRHLAVANAGDDSVSVIDTRRERVVETISLRWHPNDFLGASPNALTFDDTGRTLYVCHGTQNAIGVVAFRPGKSKLTGLLPTGWYPGAIVLDAPRRTLCVANIKGLRAARHLAPNEPVKFNSHQHFGTLSLITVPDRAELARQTAVVQRNYRRAVAALARLPARPHQPPRAVPERAGELSLFKHVVYVIKENRTYDQVLGDLREGNGDPSLCVFGENVTPNQHKLAREFVLLDNTYCSGILSADGHQWADTAFATDYMEKSFAGFPRSYPDGMEDSDVDALAYSPAGFIWDNVLAHGKTLRDYGEFAIGITGWNDLANKSEPQFLDFYHDFINGTGRLHIGSRPAIESLRPHLATNTIGWDMAVPDVFRAARFIEELHAYERAGTLPDFLLVCLPNDHTSGTRAGAPTPAAQIADNDLAFGQIVEALSRSKFWQDTCVFAIEDDPQAGWDHVSGYRTTAYVASPYTRRRGTVHTSYNQPALLRTMELILGLPPMNQFDATATPLTDCFGTELDLTPFVAVPNNIPLDRMNPEPRTIGDAQLQRDALASARLKLALPDQCPEDLLNRILWRAQRGPRAPYPEWAITRGAKDDDD